METTAATAARKKTTWGTRLEQKLCVLTETSSKESILTVAKWMTFNRKKMNDFAPVLKDYLLSSSSSTTSTSKRGPPAIVVLSIINEVLLNERATTRWDRLADWRLAMGETVLVPVSQWDVVVPKERALNMLKEWDKANAFGNPSLIQKIRKNMTAVSSAPPTPTSGTTAAAAEEVEPAPMDVSVTKKADAKDGGKKTKDNLKPPPSPEKMPAAGDKDPKSLSSSKEPPAAAAVSQQEKEATPDTASLPNADEVLPDAAETTKSAPSTTSNAGETEAAAEDVTATTTTTTSDTTQKSATSSSAATAAAFDFEATGIPAAPVDDIKAFLEPSRAIAQLQIARDLRNDSAVQLSALLSSLPHDVRAACAKAAEQEADENGETVPTIQLSDAQARDFSMRTKPVLLDMDLEEQLANIRSFRDIVDRQRVARSQVLRLLIQSRCRLGANEAAEAFFRADRAKDALAERKQILADAMELEGLDVITTQTGNTAEDENKAEQPKLAPLTWYKPDEEDGNDDNTSEPEAKRQKVA